MPRAPGPSPRLTIPLALLGAPVLGACKVVPPPPLVAFHEATAAAPRGDTSVVVAVGLATQALGGGGYGAVIRLEHQQTDRTALGAELAIAHGAPDSGSGFWLFGLRGYGRSSSLGHDWAAVTYGAGATALTTGMIALTANATGAVSYPNSHFEPYLAAGLALSVPLRDGEPFGDMVPHEPVMGGVLGPVALDHPPRSLSPVVFLTFDPGFVVPLGDTGHALSLEMGTATALAGSGGFISLSVADSHVSH